MDADDATDEGGASGGAIGIARPTRRTAPAQPIRMTNELDDARWPNDLTTRDDGDATTSETRDDEDEDEPPSEFWPAAELLKGATITDAELELSYSVGLRQHARRRIAPLAADARWRCRMVQVDEPHAVWFYRQAHRCRSATSRNTPIIASSCRAAICASCAPVAVAS